MALVTEKPVTTFDLEQIGCGYLLWGRHKTWDEGKSGIVTSATENQLIIQYHPGIGNITNHFIIPVSEVISGEWEIRWSSDMSDVQEFGIKEDEEQQEKEEDDRDNDTGGTDT